MEGEAFYIKEQLFIACRDHLNERSAALIKARSIVKESLLNETKSSAGDKFETTRAILQAEDGKLNNQQAQLNVLKATLSKINLNKQFKSIQLGSVVETKIASYFLAIPIGKIEVKGNLYYSISFGSPVGKAIIGKEKGDYFHFNGKEIEIVNIF